MSGILSIMVNDNKRPNIESTSKQNVKDSGTAEALPFALWPEHETNKPIIGRTENLEIKGNNYSHWTTTTVHCDICDLTDLTLSELVNLSMIS